MRMVNHLGAALAAAGAFLSASLANAAVIGVAVNPGDNSPVGQTEFRSALGGQAIRYFIPLSDASGTYGVSDSGNFGLQSDSGDGGGILSMFLLFSPVTTGVDHVLEIMFEDLDLIGANDPSGFFENIEVLSADGSMSFSSGAITNIGGLITGNADTQQLLTLAIGAVSSDPFLLRLDFAATFDGRGRNTPEFLIAELSEIPLPGALSLFLAGIAGFGFAAHSKKRK